METEKKSRGGEEEKRGTKRRVWDVTKGHLCDSVKQMKRDNVKW